MFRPRFDLTKHRSISDQVALFRASRSHMQASADQRRMSFRDKFAQEHAEKQGGSAANSNFSVKRP